MPPDKRQAACSANIPSYPGFENDVFEVVKDYFVSLLHKKGPLTTYKLFDIFVSAFIKAEAVGLSSTTAPKAVAASSLSNSASSGLPSSASSCLPTSVTSGGLSHLSPPPRNHHEISQIVDRRVGHV